MFGFNRKRKKQVPPNPAYPSDVAPMLKPVAPCVTTRYERGQRIDEIAFTNGKTYKRKFDRKDPMKRFMSQLTKGRI